MEIEERTNIPRNQPILLIAAGSDAVGVVNQLPQAAKAMSVRVAGPFGLMVARGGGRIRTSSCLWLSEISVPDMPPAAGPLPGRFDEAAFNDLCSLVRRLRATGQESQDSGSRVQIHAYVILDLTSPGVVPFIVQLVQLVRQVDPSIEMTGLALTGRTVGTGITQESRWYEVFEQLVGDMEKTHLLQRLYVLDGEDTSRTWLESPKEMQRIAAEFILHHGMSPYRHHLRRHEKTRTSLKEGFLDFCGAVMCKRFRWDPSAVAHEIAVAAARDPSLEDLDHDVLSQERSNTLDGVVERLMLDVSAAYESEDPSTAAPDSQESSLSSEASREKKATTLLEHALEEVCAEKPLLSLRWFLVRLRAHLDELTTLSRLRTRWDSRHRVAEALRKQFEDTYAPMKRWQEQRDVRWHTPFQPSFKDAPLTVVSRPVSIQSYLTAIGIAAVGLMVVGVGHRLDHPGAVVAGGIVAVWAGMVAALDTRWTTCRKVIVPEDYDASQAAATSYYQVRPSNVQLLLFVLLLMGALAGLGWSLVESGRGAATIGGIVSGCLAVVFGLVSAVLLYSSVVAVEWPEGTPEEAQTPEMMPPVNRPRFFAGLLSLTAAWGALCQTVGSFHVTFASPVLAPMLALAWAAIALVQFPRCRSIDLVCKSLRLPVPPAPLEAKVVEEPGLAHQVRKLRAWVDRLMVVPISEETGGLEWNQAGLEDPLPRMFSPDWRNQLARTFKAELEDQTGKTLAQMVADPGRWARCLVEGLSDPELELSNPLHIFCLYHVKRWLQEKPLERILSQLAIDRERLLLAVNTCVSPRWPQTRDDPEVDASIIGVGKELWGILSPFAKPDDPHRFIQVNWQEPYTVAVVRTVQGLSRGWRGYPGVPGRRKPNGNGEEIACVTRKSDALAT